MPPAAAAAAKGNVLGSNKRRQPPADVYRHDHHSCAKAPRWLAGNVEAFNIPGTNYTQPTGLRFLPSCYQWQNMCSRG